MDKAEAIKLLSGECGKALLKNMMNYVTSFSWGSLSHGQFAIFNNGTAFILDLGAGPFLVTAAHVYEGYLTAKQADPSLLCFIGSLRFDPTEKLLCCHGSKALDIATFRIDDEDIIKINKQVAYGSNSWHTELMSNGDGALFCGFPGKERIQKGSDEYVFGLYTALTPVSSTSERHFGCMFSHDSWIDTLGEGLPDVGYDMGGMSGGPVFKFKETESGILTWSFSGVIYNAMNDIAEIMYAHHAKFIHPSGSLIVPI